MEITGYALNDRNEYKVKGIKSIRVHNTGCIIQKSSSVRHLQFVTRNKGPMLRITWIIKTTPCHTAINIS
jgi:hypothetical protein